MLAIFILLFLVFIILLYWIPRKLGYPKTGIILVLATITLLISFVLYQIYVDKFFEKSTIRTNLRYNEIVLLDNFKILEFETNLTQNQYYQTQIKVSEEDKNNIIATIKNANNYQEINNIEQITVDDSSNELYDLVIMNYKQNKVYIRKSYLKTETESPIWDSISINESNNILSYKRFSKE